MEQSFARKLSNAILIFLFTLSIFILIVITVVQNTLFSSDFLIRQVDASGFSSSVLAEMQETFRSYTDEFDIPDDFVTDHITLEQVDEAIKQTITSSFNHTAPYDYSSFTDPLFNDLKDYIEAQLPFPIDLTEQMSDFSAKCEQVFVRYTNAAALLQVASLSRNYGFLLEIGQMIFAAVALILLVALLKFSISWADRFRKLIYAFSGLVLLNGVCFCARFLSAHFFLTRLGMNSDRESVRLFVIQCINSTISVFNWPLMISAFMLIVVIFVYCLIRIITKKRMQENR